MDAQLMDAVEHAYRVFGGRTVGPRLHVCHCPVCFGDDVESELALIRTPLREIPAKLLAEYTNSAHEWDDEMLYFLPRYLELIADEEPPHPFNDLAYTLSRLHWIDWRATWPTEWREAMDRFFIAIFRHYLRADELVSAWRHPDGVENPYYWGSSLEGVFCMVSNAHGETGPLLQILEDDLSLCTSLHIGAIINDAGTGLINGSLTWHTLETTAERVIVAWLRRARTLARLEEAFFAAETEIDQNTLSLATTILGAAVEAAGTVGEAPH